MFATIILNTRQKGIGNGLTYTIPKEKVQIPATEVAIKIGDLVKVPLRRNLVEGIVIDVSEKKPEGNFDLKEIKEILSETPLLDSKQIEIARFIAKYYCCTLREAISPFLPGTQWSALLPKRVEMMRLVQLPRDERLGTKQQAVIDYLRGKDWITIAQLRKEVGVGRDVLKRLQEREFVAFENRMGEARFAHTLLEPQTRLTPRQEIACKAIEKDARPALLFGITGSGKTEVYAELIRKTIKQGKSAILLLPEILLTENVIDRFQQVVARKNIAVLHSRLSLSQRRKEWRRCRSGEACLAIGSRSALFAPLNKLGLIVIDEEHEWTYKNEQSPRYHAAKVAEQLVALYDAKLVLGSATPSVESWQKAQSGTYQFIELPERYGGAMLPSVQVVDLGSTHCGDYYPFSPTLINAIRERLNKHEQSILFLNRRGHASGMLCLECRNRLEDPETNLPYTVHMRSGKPILISHHSGAVLPVPAVCSHCGSTRLHCIGTGTQKLETLIEKLFPEARILRADADTLKSPEQMRMLLQTMNEGRADILLGTQSVVKGLDLPNVTLAAVVLADVGLSIPFYRAGERVFQLLTQLTGRSGRAKPGEVIIQTYRPEAPEIKYAAAHAVREYLHAEYSAREKAQYPPCTPLVRVAFSGDQAGKDAQEFSSAVRLRHKDIKITCTPSLFRGRSQWQVYLRGSNAMKIVSSGVKQGVIDIDPLGSL